MRPVIVLWDVNPIDLAVIIDFMYHSEVNVKTENLNSFLVVAECLSVRGLCRGYKGAAPDSRDVSRAKSATARNQTLLGGVRPVTPVT